MKPQTHLVNLLLNMLGTCSCLLKNSYDEQTLNNNWHVPSWLSSYDHLSKRVHPKSYDSSKCSASLKSYGDSSVAYNLTVKKTFESFHFFSKCNVLVAEWMIEHFLINSLTHVEVFTHVNWFYVYICWSHKVVNGLQRLCPKQKVV